MEVAQAILNITPSMRGLQALIDREMRGADTRRAGRDAGEGYTGGFGESAKKLTGVLAGAFAAVKVGDFAKDAVAQASDLAEAGSKLQVVFGDATGSVNDFASGGAKAFGQSKLAIQNAAAQFGVYGKAAGLAGSANADFSKNLVGLSTDLASFYNTDPAQAAEAISAGLRGESEPLRQYGVLLDDATLRNKALQLGLITTTKEALTPANKVLAAQASIMEQTTLAQGDFARTSGGLANQQRILSAQWTDMKGKLGAAFLPVVTATVTALNDHLFPVLESLGTKAQGAWSILAHGDFTGAGAGLGEEDSPLVGALFKAHDLFQKVMPTLKEAWSILAHGDFKGGLGIEEDSPLVDLIFKVREFGLSTFDKLKDIFTNLWGTAKALWPDIKMIATSLSDAVGSIQGAGIGAFSSFLGISDQLSGVLTQTLQPVLDWIAQFMTDNPAVVLTLVGALVAYKVVTQGIAIATEAWAAIQAVLNAVMDANPIMLIVIALAALAAAVVWAYTNVGWFKDAVDAAWSFIKDATAAMWEGVLKPAFTWIADNIHVVGDLFTWLWVNVVQPAWEGISAAVSVAWEHVIQPIAELLWAIIQKVGTVLLWLWNEVAVPALRGIGAVISWAWDTIIGPIFGFVWDIVTKVGNVFSWLWNNIVSPVMGWIGGAISAAWVNVIEPVIRWLTKALNDTGTTFSELWATVQNVWTWIQDKINTAWLWLRDNVFTPITGAISLVGTFFTSMWETIQTVWNNVSTFFVNVAKGIDDAVTKVKTAITDIKAAIDGFFERFKNWGGTQAGGVLGTIDLNPHATGTVVPGYAPGVDNYPALLSPGEAVLVPQLTRQLGPSKILAANAAAYAGGDGASMLRFATGGVIGSAGSQAGELVTAQALKLLGQKRDEMKAAIDAATAQGSSAVNLSAFNASQDPSSFGWQRAVGMVPFSFAGLGTSVAGGTTGLWAALLNALAPSIPGGVKTLGGFENRNNVNNPGVPSFHSYGLAMDVNAPWNPNGVSGYGRTGQYVIPSGPAHSLAARFGMLWGGDFNGTPDPMHFEIHLPPSAIGGAVAGTLGAAVASAVSSGGGGVAQWHNVVLQALGITGQPAAYAPLVENQMRTESSGNPRAINLTDINAQRGIPSKGLMQVIDPTFRSFALSPYNQDIYDPLSNIIASIRYVLSRYGSIPAGMRGHAYANGGIVPGVGGTDSVRAFLTPGEGVFTKPQTDAIITHAKALEAGFNGGLAPQVVINLDDSDPLQVAVAQMIDAGLGVAARKFATAGGQS